ncbi:MAG: aminofutalosine synthase MqnE [Candidatus Obscuribacterales bacterium]|nr:aminofutalosine synthase MqnE [Candidatus Obscuribacterales bacterium]
MSDCLVSENHELKDIVDKVMKGERLSRQDAIRLYKSDDLLTVGRLAEYARARAAGAGKEKHVYYIHNMHLNPTNFCVETCRFCSYANPVEREKAYTWSVDRVLQEAGRGAALGINEIHMVGGLNPACDLNYYEEVLQAIKADYPQIHMKAFTAVEIEYLANLEGLSYEEVLQRLIKAGLGSMPGGGAEIFDEEVRERMAVKKTPAPVYLEIHGIAHKLGLKSNATMLTGISETVENKVDHMLLLREQQDKSGGFQCFIPLKCYYEGTDIEPEVHEPTAQDLLKDVAVSRLVLDNFPHIKAYWIQLGVELAQLALSFGADDMDGTIGEEKITHAAGAKTPLQLAKERMEELISSSGYQPVERDTIYNIKAVSSTAPKAVPPLQERLAVIV